MSDYYDKDGIHSPEGYGEEPRKRRLGGTAFLVTGVSVILLVMLGTAIAITRGEGGAPTATAVSPDVASPPPSSSLGITQEQLDALGASIQARYRSGDTEVAQALLDDFMKAHPECVSAVQSGGEGRRLIDTREQTEQARFNLEQTAPYEQVFTTVITNRVDGIIKVAVLGVSCEI